LPARTSRRTVIPGVRPWEVPAASLVFLVLAAAMTWPMAAAPGSGTHDYTDTLFNTWLMAWNVHSASTLQNPLAPPVFLGQPDAYGRNDLLLPQSLAAMPIMLLGGSALAAHNIVFVLSLAFAGMALFLLARELTLDFAAALFAGGAFVCSPFFQSHLWHLQLQSAGFAILAIRQALRIPGGGRAWPVSLLVLLQFTASLYYWFFLDLALILALPWLAARGRRHALLLAGWLLVGNLFTLPVLMEIGSNSTRWPVDAIASTDVSVFISPWENSLLTGSLRPVTTLGESALWPGLAAVCCATAHALRRNRGDGLPWGWYLAAMGAFFAMLSLGPTLSVFGRQVSAAPGRILGALPGFSSIRLPARGGFLFVVPVLLAAGYSMRRRPALAMAGLVLSLAESIPAPMRLQPVAAAPFHHWLAVRDFSAIAILPVGTSLDRPEGECSNLYGSILHFTPMVNGYSTSLPAGYAEMAETLDGWPSEEADSLLRALGVECLVCRGWVAPGADTVWGGPRPTSAVLLDPAPAP